MAIDEAQRLHLAKAAEQAMGSEAAVALMTSLPPTGWGDVATKQDLAVLRAEFRAEMAELRTEMAELRAEFHGAVVRMQRWTVTTGIAVAGVVVAVSRLG